MIAVESFKMYRAIDALAVFVLALAWAALARLTSFLVSDVQIEFIVSLLLANVLMVMAVLMVRKAGAAMIFYLLGSMITMAMPVFSGFGWTKVLLFGIAGFVFELSFLILKIEVRNVPLDIILCTIFSNIMMPFFTGAFLSATLASVLPYNFINLILLFMIVGLLGSSIAILVWSWVKTTRLVLRFEYGG